MWGFDWEPVISAGIAAVFALVGVILTVRSQSGKTRDAGLAQHQEQDRKLDQLIDAQKRLELKVDTNKDAAVNGLSDLKGQVAGVVATTNVLFGMIVDLDGKVTRRPNNTKTTTKNTRISVEEPAT